MRSKRPEITPAERARIKAIFKSLPQKLRTVGDRAEKAIDRLYNEGCSWKLAESKVMRVLTDNAAELQQLNTAPTLKQLRELKLN